jgi:nucleoside 2-deoxyribosyltransferase
MKKIYMAGPLFTTAERRFNHELAVSLRQRIPDADFILPQDRAVQLFPDLSAIVRDCLHQVRIADLVLACLDGSDADSGTCVEVGVAIECGKPVLGYRTDFRASEDEGLNAMLSKGCTRYIRASSLDTPLIALADSLAQCILKTLKD